MRVIANGQYVVVPFSSLRFARNNTDIKFSQDKIDALRVIEEKLDMALAQIESYEKATDPSKWDKPGEQPPIPELTRIVMVLTGAAGTGKTTLMRSVANMAEQKGFAVEYAAPTGKAASRLAALTGKDAMTVHRMLMEAPTEMGYCPRCREQSEALGMSEQEMRKKFLARYTCPKCNAMFPLDTKIVTELVFETRSDVKKRGQKTLLIIDEASMIGQKLYNDILSTTPLGWPILFVGDREQLEPVNDSWGADFSNPTVNLTQVHRQAGGNPILDLATRIRTGSNREDVWKVGDEYKDDRRFRLNLYTDNTQPAEWLAYMRQNRLDATLIAPTNDMRRVINAAVRRARGLDVRSIRLGVPLVRGDRVLVLLNHYGTGSQMMNGEVFIVNHSFKGPRVPSVIRDEESGEERVTYHNTVWVQFFPKPDWYLMPVKAFQRDSFSVRDFRGVFDTVTKKDYAFEKAIERAAEAGRTPNLPAKQLSLYRRLHLANQVMRQAALALQDEKNQIVRADELARLDMVPLLLNEYVNNFRALPRSYTLFADYGECLTCHKAQGSQWKHVGLVVPQKLINQYRGTDGKIMEEARRWLYTAVTRASETLIVWSAP